ncbi:MAG TPA: hypothetical protein VGF97_15095 [Rhizomicrobium sp.]|jgi:hypothetical protein
MPGRAYLLTIFACLMTFSVQAAPPAIEMRVLANGDVRLDNGPRLKPDQLSFRLAGLVDARSVRRLHVIPDPKARYANVARVIEIVEKTNRRLVRDGARGFDFGIVGMEGPDR